MAENYIEKIQLLYHQNKTNHNTFILNFHPTKFVFTTKKEYTHSRDYSRVCSMFSTLIQSKTTHGIFDVMHDHLSRISRNIIYIKEPYVKLVIHGNNILSKLKSMEISFECSLRFGDEKSIYKGKRGILYGIQKI